MTNAPSPLVECAPESVGALRELFERELRHRRLFVVGQFQFAERQRCTLCLHHPLGMAFEVEAEAVYVKHEEPAAGVGLDLVGLDLRTLDALARFVNAGVEPAEGTSSASPAAEAAVESAEFSSIDGDSSSARRCAVQPNTRTFAAGAPAEPTAVRLYDRIRKLTLRQREGVAREGLLTERVALERTYGSSVWEALLQNPQLSMPEVARIAKNGTLPVPLVAVIVANVAWLQCAEVRRALLSNPRVSGAHLERVLKALPRAELKQIAQLSPYRSQVRMAAKRLIGE